MKIKVQWAKYPKRLSQSKRSGQFARGDEQLRNWKRGSIHKKLPTDGVRRTKQQPTRTVMKGEFVQLEKTAKMIEVETV